MFREVLDYKIENAYGFDYETVLIDAQKLAPPSVCFSIAHKEQGAAIISDGDQEYQEYMRTFFETAIDDPTMYLIAHNAKFDAWVFLLENPDKYDVLSTLYARGQIIDTMIVEKLINLSSTGRISTEPPRDFTDENAKGKKIDYALSDLVTEISGKRYQAVQGRS